jgi:uncharacterized protein (UPF0332 family)
MGNGLSPALQKLLEERKLMKMRTDRKLVLKEMAAAKADLKDAKESLEISKFKWATIQGYYSMFHSARALLYDKGFREKSHHALLAAIRELYAYDIERSLIQDFEHGMYLRQEADYGLKFSESGARDVIETAEKLFARASTILKKKEKNEK